MSVALTNGACHQEMILGRGVCAEGERKRSRPDLVYARGGCGPKEDPAAPMSLAETKTDTALTWGLSGPSLLLFMRLRGKDSNLDYLIQSQASYH